MSHRTRHTPHNSKKTQQMKYITVATAVALAIGFVLGTAYGDKVPVIYPLAKKMPGASKPSVAA